MGRIWWWTLLSVLSLGCGGGHPEPETVAFLNQTQHSDSDLWAIWHAAQQNLSNQIDLNPLQQEAPAKVLPGDPRALNVQPSEIAVAPVLDVSSAALAAATGMTRSDPTGLIACPQPCNVRYATAYSRYQPASTQYAASWEASEANFRAILEYEFENQILFALGYDMRWR